MTKYWIHAINAPNWTIETKRGRYLFGMSKRWKGLFKKLQENDIIVFYILVTGHPRDPRAKKVPGIFRVVSQPYYDTTPEWPDGVYPHRAKLEPILVTESSNEMLPIKPLVSQLSFIKNEKTWGRVFQTALVPISKQDFQLLRNKLEESITKGKGVPPDFRPTHTSIEWALVFLGRHASYEIWVTRSDRGKKYAGTPIGADTLGDLPDLGVGAGVKSIIENIDVLWLRRSRVVAAFEVEHTTNIQSGLTRLNDLVLAAPNLSIELYIVAPDERRTRLERELRRLSFENLQDKVSFIPYSRIIQKLDAAQQIISLGGTLTETFLIEEAERVIQ
ncbi:MAG: EVE domain-containing protein [Candidatus Thorarchaeota archaeon]